jgi:hypothetical protein
LGRRKKTKSKERIFIRDSKQNQAAEKIENEKVELHLACGAQAKALHLR